MILAGIATDTLGQADTDTDTRTGRRIRIRILYPPIPELTDISADTLSDYDGYKYPKPQLLHSLAKRLSERRVKQNMLLYLNRRLVRGIADIVAVDDGKKEQNLAKRAVRDIEKALTARLAAATDASAASGAAAAAGGGAESSEPSFEWEQLADEGLSWVGAAAAGSNDDLDSF
jgi:hypothetical protein